MLSEFRQSLSQRIICAVRISSVSIAAGFSSSKKVHDPNLSMGEMAK